MKYFFKTTTLLVFLILTSYPLYSQLKVESYFNRDKSQLNVTLTNDTPYVMLFMTQKLSTPPYISIESLDSLNNSIEWLRLPPSEHNGPWLSEKMWEILKQNESYRLSFNIKPDKSKREPKYFEVTYSLPCMLYDVDNIENEKEFLKKNYKYFVRWSSFWFRTQYEAKCQ